MFVHLVVVECMCVRSAAVCSTNYYCYYIYPGAYTMLVQAYAYMQLLMQS